MLRSSSNQGAYLNDDDDDDDDDDDHIQPTSSNKGARAGGNRRCGEMLAALSQEYEEKMERRRSSSYEDGVGDNDDDDDGDKDEDTAQVLDYRDESERDAQSAGDYDLFSLVKSSGRSGRARSNAVDPGEWRLPFTQLDKTCSKSERQSHSASSACAAAPFFSSYSSVAASSTPTATAAMVAAIAASSAAVSADLPGCNFAPEEGLELFMDEVEQLKLVFGEENVELIAQDDSKKAPASSSATDDNNNNNNSGSATERVKSSILQVRVQVLSPSDLALAMRKRHIKKSAGLFVSFVKPKSYPLVSLEPFIEPWSSIFSFGETQTIYNAVMDTVSAEGGEPCLFNMTQAASAVASHIINAGGVLIDKAKRNQISEMMRKAGFRVRLGHERLNPTTYTGSVASILCKIPSGFDVQLVENVMRGDLANRFEAMQATYFNRYVKGQLGHRDPRNDSALAALADSVCVFHGSRMATLDSIIGTGMRVPGKSQVRCGSRFGRGIYVTPDPSLALNYAESGRTNEYSVKLLVCAVLPGRTRIITEREEDDFWGKPGVEEGYDSHTACAYGPGVEGVQIVLFNPAQVLVCYVIHLMERRAAAPSAYQDLGSDKLSEVKRRFMAEMCGGDGDDVKLDQWGEPILGRGAKKNHNEGKSATDRAAVVKRKNQIMTDTARKNLPFGFGPAGSNFVVEGIASCSDDDEDLETYVGYGTHKPEAYEEYQHAARNGGGTNNDDDDDDDD